MRISSLSWVLPLVLALTLHHVLASSDADAQTSAQEREDPALVRSKRGLNMLRLGRGLQMLRLGKRGSEFEGSDFDYSPSLDPLLFQMLMEDSEPTVDSFEDSNSYDGYYTPGGSLITRYRRSLDDMPYSDEDLDDEAFEGEEEKRGLGMLRLGKRNLGMLRLGKRQLGMLRLGKRQLGMLRLGKRPMGMLRLGKRPMGMLRLGKRGMGMLRLGKRPMGMLRLGKRPMGMLRLGKRPMGMLRLGKKDDEDLKEEDKRAMGMLRLGKKDDEDLKEEDKRAMGMLRLGKRDLSVATSQ